MAVVVAGVAVCENSDGVEVAGLAVAGLPNRLFVLCGADVVAVDGCVPGCGVVPKRLLEVVAPVVAGAVVGCVVEAEEVPATAPNSGDGAADVED